MSTVTPSQFASNPVYPYAIKVFTTYHDYSDIIFAHSMNELHDEVGSIETTLGTNPVAAAPATVTTVGGAISDLYSNKANKAHQHTHNSLPDDYFNATGGLEDDHLQYSRCDALRPYTQPVGGQWATQNNHLVPLGQVQSFGYINLAQANALILASLTNLVRGASGGSPLAGSPTGTNWTLTGGFVYGCTDSSGHLPCNFNGSTQTNPGGVGAYPFSQCLQAFVATKVPAWGFPHVACAPYNWIEAQITVTAVSVTQAMVQFSHDYSWQGNLWAAYTWLAIGQ